MKVKYKSPTPISKVRKDVIGDFKPLFGTGTGAGDIKCPLCYAEIGHLMVYPEIAMDTDLDQATVVGEVNEHHEVWGRKCPFEHKMPNLSDVQVRDLMVGVRPKGMLPMDYEDKVTGPGMVYRYDDRKQEGVWILDNFEYSTYLYARGRELLKDIGSRYGTLVDGDGKKRDC